MSDIVPAAFCDREAVSPQEFVVLSGLSIATVRRYIAGGRLPCIQPGGRRCRVLIPRKRCPVHQRFQRWRDEEGLFFGRTDETSRGQNSLWPRGPCKSFCVRVAGERYLPFFGMRPSNMTAKWLRASFQLRIGIVHFLAASLIAMYTIFKADSSLG